MKAYRVSRDEILVETEKIIYYIWDFYPNEFIVDQFVKLNQKIKYLGCVCCSTDPIGSINKVLIDQITKRYLEKASYPKTTIEQYLTHSNNEVREIIKKIIDGSL